MEPKNYTVLRIEGDYAILKEDDGEAEVFISLALLPEGVFEGTRLHYEMFAYSLAE